MIRPFWGIQEEQLLTELVAESQLPARAQIQGHATIAIEKLKEYCPPVDKILGDGSTAIIGRVRRGVVLKYPRYAWLDCPAVEVHQFVQDIRPALTSRSRYLGFLGQDASIIKFLGSFEDPRGLLFAEANSGNLQECLDSSNDTIDERLRLKWRTQVAEAIRYLHLKGVIHCDLRHVNCLLHTDGSGILNLYLSDFGDSTRADIDGGHLPDSGFFDPRKPWVSTKATDIFNLGSVFYTIMTGHWPYKAPGPFGSVVEKERYEEKVDALFS